MPRKKRGIDLPGMKVVESGAQLWKRILAFLIDLIVLDFIVIGPFKKYFSIPSGGYSAASDFISSNSEVARTLTLAMAIVAVLALFYFSFLESRVGQTLGKYLFRIYVRSGDRPPSFWRCLVSNMTLIPFFPFMILWIIDPIHMFFSKGNQRLMEKFTKITVVQKYTI